MGPTCTVTDVDHVKRFRYVNVHISLTKQKTGATRFLLPNMERNYSILRI
jgi:hypothetical protein